VLRRVVFLAVLLAPIVAVRPAFGEGRSVDAASTEDKDAAQDAFKRGMEYFDRDDYEAALKEFRASYDRVKSPNSHFMVARTMARQGNNADAYTELLAVIEESEALGARYKDTTTAAREKLAEVRSRIGLLTVKVGRTPKGTRVLLGEEPLPAAKVGKAIPVLPGDTTVTAVTPDGKRHPQTVTLHAGDEKTVTVEVVPPPPAEKSFVEKDEHTRYLLELEAHFVGETVTPNDHTGRGAGVGARVNVEILRKGLISGVNDSVGLGTGVDWLGTRGSHFLVPLVATWNFWLIPELSVFVEPGANLLLGAGTQVKPTVYVGARVRVWRRLNVTARVGLPDATLGASWLF
jgi:hypothetical protein